MNPKEKPANIYLLLDMSESMRGGKLSIARKGSESFIARLEDDRDRVGLIAFSDEVNEVHSFGPTDKAAFVSCIQGLEAGGQTALYEAVTHAIDSLQQIATPERSNVIVAMPYGHNTKGSLDEIGSSMTRPGTPVSIFTVAYGGDADMDVMRQIAQSGHRQAYKANRRTIRGLYELLSAFY